MGDFSNHHQIYLSTVHKGLRSLQIVLSLNCRGNTPQHSSGGSCESQTETVKQKMPNSYMIGSRTCKGIKI